MRTILLLIAGSAVALRGQDVPAGTKGTAEAVSADAEKASVPANAEAGEVESAELPAEGGNGDGFAARRASRRVAGMRSRLSILEALAPPGSEHREVRAPFYREFVPRDLTGVLELDTVGIPAEVESIFESRRVQRPDDGHLVFENAVFTEYADGEGSEEISRRLQLERGVYDLSMDLIVSDRPVVIEERDRRIESGGMLHDHATGLTHFTGGVRMVVYEEVPEGEVTASAEAAPDAQPSPPATPPAVATPAAKPSARAAAKPAARAAAKPVAKPATRKPGTAAGRTRTSAKPR
ncbi:MAG: hypothetical protein RLZZ179_2648 [Verrucomicrobiota bacterium]